MAETRKPAKSAAKGKSSEGFSDEERAAMKDRAKELKSARSGKDGTKEFQEKLAEMPASEQKILSRLHAIVQEVAPSLTPQLWYGMPGWAKGGKILCFFQSAAKFKSRYPTLGFSDIAMLDDGPMWPTSYAVTELTKDGEAKFAALIKKAAG